MCMQDDIKFYIPKYETIPTALLLYVGNVFVRYERIHGGFRFYIDGSATIPCGYCGEELRVMYNYCPWCGQKIDWGK